MILIEEKQTQKVPGITSLFVTFDYNPIYVDLIKTIPQCNFDKDTKQWEVPTAYTNDLLDKFCVYDSIQLNLLNTEPREIEQFELNAYKTTPFNYQLEGIQYGLNHDKWLLLDEPGLGKTLQLIYLAQELKEKEGIEHCLIICGINTLKFNWKKEIQKHSNLSCRILGEKIGKRGGHSIGSTSERAEELKNPIDEFFIITNIETFRSDEIMKAFKKTKNKIDMIVVDEIHTCKSPTSQQGKHLLKLDSAKYKVGATGTLLLNDPLDAYMPLKWIGAERAPFSTFKYFYYNYGGPFNNTFIGFKNIDVLKNQIEEYSLRRQKDLLDLPPKFIIEEYVEMDTKQQQFYNNIKEGIIEQVDKVHMSTTSILAMIARLRQATACPSILTTENIDSAKMNRCVDLTEQIVSNGHKVVIFSTFKDTVYQLEKALKKFNPTVNTGDIKDEVINKNIHTFLNDKNSMVFLATWQKCGTGITLTSADYMIFIDTPWTSAVFDQACDRIYRIGTKSDVFIYNLITKDTIDERVLEILQDKEAIADYIIDDEVNEKALEKLRKYIQELN